MSWLKIIYNNCVPIPYYILAPIFGTYLILMLFLTDSFDETFFWLCVMFS